VSGALRRECRVDAGGWRSCTSRLLLSRLTAGKHTVRMRVTDPVGHVGIASRTWTVDRSAPSVDADALTALSNVPTVHVRWSAHDSGGSGLASYDVEQRHRLASGALSPWHLSAALARLLVRRASVPDRHGEYLCVRVRSRDHAGNVSHWNSAGCTRVV